MKLRLVQMLRGLAASMVVVFHAQGMAPNYVGGESFSGMIMGDFGGHGVDLFFVLSGFIIRYAQPKDGYRASDFALRRIQRVVPIYWLITAIMLAAWLALSGFYRSEFPSGGQILRSFLFASFVEGKSPVLYVGWSLEYEMLFYGTVLLLLLIKPRFPIWPTLVVGFSGLVIAGSAVKLVSVDWPSNPTLYFLTNSLLIEFALGVAIADSIVERKLSRPSLVALACALIAVGLNQVDDRALLYGIPSALLLILALYAENKRHWTVSGFWVRLGDASYSIYLVQVLALSAAAKLVKHLLPGLTADLFVVIVTAVSLAAGYAFYLSVEAPLSQYFSLRRRKHNLRTLP